MSKRDYAVVLKKYSKVLNGEEIISPTTYAFPQNRIGVFIGKAEVEKSYLLRAIGDHESFEQGDIQIQNSFAQKNDKEYKKNVFLVSPNIDYNLPCSIEQIPGVLSLFYSHWNFETFKTWINHFKLPEAIMFSKLTRIEKAKTLTCIALASGVGVLAFEDIDAYLNIEEQHNLIATLEIKRMMGCTVLIGSKHITRWMGYDLDLYTFHNKKLMVIDTVKLRKKIANIEEPYAIPSTEQWRESSFGDDKTITRTIIPR
jgi:ABC-type cobalamin/Fe3+-siderophores transport system ATPase subunit